jgi:hypothetical protein
MNAAFAPRGQFVMMDPRMQFEEMDGDENMAALLEASELAEKVVDADFYNDFADNFDVEDLD